jgi:hypothetical protein
MPQVRSVSARPPDHALRHRREASATAAAFVCGHSRRAKYGAFEPRFVSNDRVELRGRRKYNPVIRKTGDPSVPVDADDGGRILRIEGAPPVVAFVR